MSLYGCNGGDSVVVVGVGGAAAGPIAAQTGQRTHWGMQNTLFLGVGYKVYVYVYQCRGGPRLLVHCYGHGGSGITLAMGCAG